MDSHHLPPPAESRPDASGARDARSGQGGRKRARRVAAWLGAATLLTAGIGWAATTLHYSASHVTNKSPEQVLAVLTAYNQVCDRGCKYYGPYVVESMTVPYRRTRDDYYTWTFMSAKKDVRYFNHVHITRRGNGSILVNTRQLDDDDDDLVDELEDRTGREHDPAFDEGETRVEIVALPDGHSRVTQSVRLTASGFLALITGKIRQGMEAGTRAVFRNLDK
jgi:hypothetical protein